METNGSLILAYGKVLPNLQRFVDDYGFDVKVDFTVAGTKISVDLPPIQTYDPKGLVKLKRTIHKIDKLVKALNYDFKINGK